jgi:hypothetical protein
MHGVPTPRTMFPRSPAKLRSAAEMLGLPVVVKNARLWDPLSHPAVPSTPVLHTTEDVEALEAVLTASGFGGLLVQEYLPQDPREGGRPPDWFTHFYCDGEARARVIFTCAARKHDSAVTRGFA